MVILLNTKSKDRRDSFALLWAVISALMIPFQVAQVIADEYRPAGGVIIHRGLIDCFEEGLRSDSGQLIFCEASALVFENGVVTIASDKPVPGPGRSAVFSIPYAGSGPLSGPVTYHTAKPLIEALKYEDMTLTPDGRYVIATTGFDRVKSESNEWDGFNTLLYWPTGEPAKVRVVEAQTEGGVTSSVGLRARFSHALRSPDFPDEVPYFKVESVAAVPGGRLLFGIREIGARYDRFAYSFKIVSVPYLIDNGDFIFTGDFELAFDFDTASTSLIGQATALSSMEFDAHHDSLYMLTSFENNATDEGLGGYLWNMPMKALEEGLAPEPVIGESGLPLQFAHKAEGVVVLNENTVLVIHDDDRVLGRDHVEDPVRQFSRKPHQAAYTLVSIQPAARGRVE